MALTAIVAIATSALRRVPSSDGVIVLDVAFILGVLALAGLVAIVAKGVEKL